MARTMENYTLKWAFHDIAPNDLKPGDHIYKWSSVRHAYHGIVLEQDPANETVVNDAPRDARDRIMVLRFPCSCCRHDCNSTRAQRETLRSFEARSQNLSLAGGVKVARYGVSKYETWVKRYGTCYPVECDITAETLRRADTLLNDRGGPVSLESSSRKCEHLAFWCKTGLWQSKQIEGVRRASMVSVGAAVATGLSMSSPAVGLVSLVGAGLVSQMAFKRRQMSKHVENTSEDCQREPKDTWEELQVVNDEAAADNKGAGIENATGASSSFQEGKVAADGACTENLHLAISDSHEISDAQGSVDCSARDAAAHFSMCTPRIDYVIATPRLPDDQESSAPPPSDRLGVWYESPSVAPQKEESQNEPPPLRIPAAASPAFEIPGIRVSEFEDFVVLDTVERK
eukprot:gnl/MRDRNA2_/MRDRNA2_43392_c0_seq1.p1 gnl/MRDRNA2_/MRDRNA2_43392_c0~~gnl/MRDRNA2_/MRDRNA2_43392_c0_seq1.p1  ORF type:complete len:401 (-),score=54.99 gnl/MRDRNA2_/MRDRNA2_43392_c0_seq1:495-1697(-)